MKTTLNLLNEIANMGYDRERVLYGIDSYLDLKDQDRPSLEEEVISDELYSELKESIILGLECEKETY